MSIYKNSWVMPAEWQPHECTWMAWPSSGYTLGDTSQEHHEARQVWANVANAIVDFEPVRMLVTSNSIEVAKQYLDDRVQLIEAELDDAWMRDIGPTFVKDPIGNLAAVNWVFNGWGQQPWASWKFDSLVAKKIADISGTPELQSPLINEGGGIHVNGLGTVLLTETVQLGKGRNEAWSKQEVEDELRRKIGATDFVWIKRGLTRDYDEFGTRGHIDIVACFSDENTILYHDQRNTGHPDFEVTQEVVNLLAEKTDFKLIPLVAPTKLKDEDGWVDFSYVNHYVANGCVIACSFDDANDELARETLQNAYPNRKVIMVNAVALFERGGGIHCITQQQPAQSEPEKK